MIFIYILVSFFASLIGSVTGLGGGIILKPVMDLLGNYDAATVGLLSAACAVMLGFIGIVKKGKSNLKNSSLLIMALASAFGGVGGHYLFEIAKGDGSDSGIKIIQSAILAAILVVIFVYMLIQNRVKKQSFQSPVIYAVTGLLLGALASFLGIGGGPLNVAVIMYLFSADIKTAVRGSLYIILLSQAAKIIVIVITEVATAAYFSLYALEFLPFMLIATALGAILAIYLKRKMSEKSIVIAFNVMQILIFCISIANIIILTVNA